MERIINKLKEDFGIRLQASLDSLAAVKTLEEFHDRWTKYIPSRSLKIKLRKDIKCTNDTLKEWKEIVMKQVISTKNKEFDKYIAELREAYDRKYDLHISLVLHNKKSNVWNYTSRAKLRLVTADGSSEELTSHLASGCNYDKEASAMHNVLKRSKFLLPFVLRHLVKCLNEGKDLHNCIFTVNSYGQVTPNEGFLSIESLADWIKENKGVIYYQYWTNSIEDAHLEGLIPSVGVDDELKMCKIA